MSEPTPQTSDAQMLFGFWYPALRSHRVRGRRLVPTMLLGIPLVIGRDADGRPFAFKDACPHRGMPFSQGEFDGRLLECCYHGWQFDVRTGQCRHIPSLTNDARLKLDRLRALTFPCDEQDGYIWVYMPDRPSGDAEVPPAPRLPVFGSRYRLAHLSADLPCNVDHGIIGLMDPAHGPFVHQAWWWRTRRSIHEKEKVFEPIPNGFRIRAHAPSANSAPYKLLRIYGQPVTTTIEFVLPNMRFEKIQCGPYWFSSRATVTPITADRCRLDYCAAWNIFYRLPFMAWALKFFGRLFIEQDRRTMEKQARGLKYHPRMLLIDDADRPAKWYFQLKRAYLEAKRTNQPMKHPLPGPVTLRWRS